MNQSKEIEQIWTETENFDDICIFLFFDCYYKFYFWKKDWALSSAYNHFWNFSNSF